MKDDKRKSEVVVTKDGWIVGGKKYSREQPPLQVAQKLAKIIKELLKKDLQ